VLDLIHVPTTLLPIGPYTLPGPIHPRWSTSRGGVPARGGRRLDWRAQRGGKTSP